MLITFVLLLYWYIMEEFELPWAIISFHFLFYFTAGWLGIVYECVRVSVGVK